MKKYKPVYLPFNQIAKELNGMSVPTARGGKWYGKTVLNAANRL